MVAAYMFVWPKNEWLPPEIPQGYNYACVALGGMEAGYTVTDLSEHQRPLPFIFTKGTNGSIGISVDPYLREQSFSNNLIPIFAQVIRRRLFIDAEVRYRGGSLRIRGNSPQQQIPLHWDWNHDTNAVEVVDEDGSPVFQMIYVRPEKVLIAGHFATKSASVQIASDGYGFAGYRSDFIQPLFKYPSGLYPGQRAEQRTRNPALLTNAMIIQELPLPVMFTNGTVNVGIRVHQDRTGWQPPEIPSDITSVRVSVGGLNLKLSGLQYPKCAWVCYKQNVWVGVYVRDNRLFATFDLPTPLGMSKVDRNNIDPLPAGWDINWSTNAVEIVNDDKAPVCQVSYDEPDHLVVGGVFDFPASTTVLMPRNYGGTSMDWAAVKPIFRYPSAQHLNEYAK